MALEPGRRSVSPDSSGRDSPVPRQWRNQLGVEEAPPKDKNFRKYASGVDRALSLFDTALKEWADYISFLNRLLKALQARQSTIKTIPAKATVAKRLSQCMNPSLPSGVHQKALEVYNYIFTVIGKDNLSRDLPLYLPGLASTLSFASLSVRSPFLDVLERHFLDLDPRSLRPAMKSIVLALLPGLEEETSEDFERTLKLLERFKVAIRPTGSEDITPVHSNGDDFFWQCFFLASITGSSRRTGALAYLIRGLPRLGQPLDTHRSAEATNGADAELSCKLAQLVTTPEPGLLLRCFAAGLSDEQLLIQRGFLDLLVTHLPLHSKVLQTRVKPADLELLLRAAVGVTIRRDMSLNRRLWTWLLGPEPAGSMETESGLESPSSPGHGHNFFSSRTSYFEEFGLQPLTRALLSMIKTASTENNPSERARPYRICLSLMDRWEIGGLVVPEVFLPVVDSVRAFKTKALTKSDFVEVLRSASVFFDGVESGLIYSEILSLMAQALGPGTTSTAERSEKLELVQFILRHFNVREEEMITIHAPLTVLSILCMLEEAQEKANSTKAAQTAEFSDSARALGIAADLLELIPERAFPADAAGKGAATIETKILAAIPNVELLKRIKSFYVNDQGNLEATSPPFAPQNIAELLLQKASTLNCETLGEKEHGMDAGVKSRILMLLLTKTPQNASVDVKRLLFCLHECLSSEGALPFSTFSSNLALTTHLFTTNRISSVDLSELVPLLVRHAWEYLSASAPKYHVETVRCLWQLQSALGTSNRDIEAAICALMLERDTAGTFAVRPADPGRRFSILWSHSLQDSPTGPERRGSKTQNGEPKGALRLGGAGNYELMLTRPVFLMLDALDDERTQLFMTVKTWLNSLIGTEKLFRIFVSKIAELPFLRNQGAPTAQSPPSDEFQFTEDDDLDLAIYVLRALANVLRWAPNNIWAVLASKTVSADSCSPSLSEITGKDTEVALQEFFLHACMMSISCSKLPQDKLVGVRTTQLYRSALTLLNQILLNPFAERLSGLHLEEPLIERLMQSLEGSDPYVQVLLLDVVFASLKIRELAPVELPTSPTNEKRTFSLDTSKALKVTQGGDLPAKASSSPPPTLLKCIQAGLSSSSSRTVLDAWISFLTECLPMYSDSIFQVLIPLVETLCGQVGSTFANLQSMFRANSHPSSPTTDGPETTLISLINGLEQVLARGHDRLLAEEARVAVAKSPEVPQGFFGNMVSGVFSSDGTPQGGQRTATANDRLTVLLAFQDAVRICFTIWSWGGQLSAGDCDSKQDPASAASFTFTSLRMRNRARRLLEHLFAAETLECLETVIGIWRASLDEQGPQAATSRKATEVLNLLPALDGSRPKHTIPALFNAIYSRTNPAALDPSRRSTLTIELLDTDVVIFLVDYARSLEDDAMDEIWQDCMTFLKDLLGNPFPHRQTLPCLLEFAAILGEKVDNTNFGEQRKMRRELADLFIRLLTAIFTTRPTSFSDSASSASQNEKKTESTPTRKFLSDRADDIVGILSQIVPNLPKILVENDRVLTAATAISANVIGPTLRSKSFPDTVSQSTLVLLQELSRLPNNQKSWKKDVADAFNDARFFSSGLSLVRDHWLPLLRQWVLTDKDRMLELLGRITPPSTAGIVFGVGATSARLEADRKTQLTLRRIATLILAAADDAFVTDLPLVLEKLVELLGATATSSPSSTMRAEVYMVVRALVLKTSAIHLAALWPVINTELHAAVSSVVAPDHSPASDTYGNPAVLQACKLLDLLVCAAPDDFQLHEWLFVTDTVDAVYRSANYQPVALVDELSEELGAAAFGETDFSSSNNNNNNSSSSSNNNNNLNSVAAAQTAAASMGTRRRPLLGQPGGISDDVSMERKDELVAKVLRPFFGQLSIFAFESTYAMAQVDWEGCVAGLLRDVFDERSVVKAL